MDLNDDDPASESAVSEPVSSEADTASTIPPAPARTRRGRVDKRWVFLGAVVMLGVAAAALLSLWSLPYYALAPGSVRNTATRINVSGADTHDPEGQIGFVTVSLTERVNAFEYARAKLNDTIDLVDEDLINRGQTADEKRAEDRRRMAESKDVATLVALAHLGYEITPIGLGIEVIELTPCMPAEDVLNVQDVIVGFDGEVVEFPDDLTGPLAGKVAGDVVEIEVNRVADGKIETVDLTLGSSADPCLDEEIRSSLDEERAMVGIRLAPIIDYELPIDVDIDTDRVGGPSAGLAFTLSVIDVLTEGELTGGNKVATTGTIDINGAVGRVGGVKQKTVAARESGIDVFLVPEGEAEEAERFAGDMVIEEVLTLEDALAALDRMGGNSSDIPAVPETASAE